MSPPKHRVDTPTTRDLPPETVDPSVLQLPEDSGPKRPKSANNLDQEASILAKLTSVLKQDGRCGVGLALLYLDNYIRGTGWNSLEEPPGGNVREDFTTGSVECDAAIKRWRPGGLATTVYMDLDQASAYRQKVSTGKLFETFEILSLAFGLPVPDVYLANTVDRVASRHFQDVYDPWEGRLREFMPTATDLRAFVEDIDQFYREINKDWKIKPERSIPKPVVIQSGDYHHSKRGPVYRPAMDTLEPEVTHEPIQVMLCSQLWGYTMLQVLPYVATVEELIISYRCNTPGIKATDGLIVLFKLGRPCRMNCLVGEAGIVNGDILKARLIDTPEEAMAIGLIERLALIY